MDALAAAPRPATLIAAGVPVAVASDSNPGTCLTESLPAVAAHACLDSGLTVEETLTAITLNAAASLGLAGETGSLEPGKSADVIWIDAPDDRHLVYHWGVNLVAGVICAAGHLGPRRTMTDFSKLSLAEFLERARLRGADARRRDRGRGRRRHGRRAGRDGRRR